MTTAYALTQAIVIGGVVGWSALFASRRLMPTASRRVQARVASWLETHPPLRRLGAAMQPVQTVSGGCGTSGCSTCGACASPASSEALPLVFKPRAKAP